MNAHTPMASLREAVSWPCSIETATPTASSGRYPIQARFGGPRRLEESPGFDCTLPWQVRLS